MNIKDFLKKRQVFLEYTLAEIKKDFSVSTSYVENRILSREKLMTEFLLGEIEDYKVMCNIKDEAPVESVAQSPREPRTGAPERLLARWEDWYLARSRTVFTELVQDAILLLGTTDEELHEAFYLSSLIAQRWREGKADPLPGMENHVFYYFRSKLLDRVKEEERPEPMPPELFDQLQAEKVEGLLNPGEAKYAHFVPGMKPTWCTVSLRNHKPFVKFEDGVNPPFMCDPWHRAIDPGVAKIALDYFLDNYEWAPDECFSFETGVIRKMFWNEVRRDDGFAEELQFTRDNDGALNGFTFGRMSNDEFQFHRAMYILSVSKLKEEGK